MTITTQLEGLLPADGNYTTKDERVIAEAVKELRDRQVSADDAYLIGREESDYWRGVAGRTRWAIPLAFAAGCIASAIYVVLV